jgi:hypothetical protein
MGTVRVPGVDSDLKRLPQGVIDGTKGGNVTDLAPGVHSHPGLVVSSTLGDGPQYQTAAVYTGASFAALAVKDPNTFYVVMPPGGGQAGSLYLGNTLLVGVALSVPTAPINLSVVPGDTQVALTWVAPTSNGGLAITGYVVQRSTNATTGFNDIASVSGATRTITSTGLTNGTPYYFRVKAVNAMGDSPWSLVISAIPVTTSATVLASSDTDADAGTPVTFTATVTSGGSPVTTGTVTFKRGANPMVAGVQVNGSGVATYTTSSIPVGTWDITAVYDGETNFLGSTSNTVTQTMNFAGGPAPTTAVLVSDDSSSAIGQPVTFTVTITRTADGLPVTSGTVIFKDGATTISTSLTVNATTGVATFTTSSLSEATHPITAVYSGAPFYENSTSNVVNQVVAASGGSSPIAQVLTSSKPTAQVGAIITFRTTVKSGTVPVTFGSVVFKDNGVTLGPGVALNLFGESTYTTDALTVGSHTITAEYSGSPTYEDDVTSVSQTVVTTLSAPSPSTWLDSFNSGSLTTITNWYHYNTGVLAEGFDLADLWNPAGGSSIADVTVNTGWLTANEGPNVVNDGGGHWTITGLKTSCIHIGLPNLTFNHCYVYRADYEHIWGGALDVLNDVDTNHTSHGNLVFNYCTLTTDGTSSDSSFGDAITFSPVSAHANDFVCNNCEVTMWRAGFLSYFGVTANYCWVHDLNLFGADPHNTSGSIRGAQCRFNRNLFTDGTSSDISLYADTNPYTDFWVTENTLWVLPTHASQEVNFPLRGTGWSPLLPGYTREFCGNKMEKGLGGDNQYWSKITGNTLITGEPIFGGADTVQIPGQPTSLAGPSTGQQFGASQTLTSYHYTPSPSSTLLCVHAIGRAGTTQNPNVLINDESGSLWSVVPGCETPVEPAPSNTAQYGVSASLWKMETSSSSQAFRRVVIDPYQSTTNVAYMAAVIIEITGKTGLTLAQAPVLSAAGRLVPFGGTLPNITSGVLANNCTLGNLVMLFVGWTHEDPGGLTAPSGWKVLGNNLDIRCSAAGLWRTDFNGKSLTVPSLGPAGVAVTILCEFVMP